MEITWFLSLFIDDLSIFVPANETSIEFGDCPASHV